jgi:predicted transcriptional regulator
MYVRDLLTIADARPLTPNPDLDREIKSGFASDLMSDVLRFEVTQGLLITGLTNPQIIRTAEMADVAAVLIVRGKNAMPETVELARQARIPILGTDLIMFEACGRLYAARLPACKRYT